MNRYFRRDNQSETWAADHVEGACLTSDQGFFTPKPQRLCCSNGALSSYYRTKTPRRSGAAAAIAMVMAQAPPFASILEVSENYLLLIVKVAVATGLSGTPDLTAMALTVVVPFRVSLNGDRKTIEDVVGVVPSSV